MMCLPLAQTKLFCSSYFLGFSMGIVIARLPDKLGRKGAANILLPLFLIACYLTCFGESVIEKGIGIAIQGFLHVKIMNAYSHIYELTDEENKAFCSTFINVIDISSFTFVGLYLYFIDRDATRLLQYAFYVQATFITIYLLIIPESPMWLFL